MERADICSIKLKIQNFLYTGSWASKEVSAAATASQKFFKGSERPRGKLHSSKVRLVYVRSSCLEVSHHCRGAV